jgi:LAO/AO transport system kinase
MSDQSGSLIDLVEAGEIPALARFLTVLERDGTSCFARFPGLLRPSQQGFRIGITGPPGAGKSTLIGQMIGRFRARGLRVGVIAVDPSSPFSRGAVLGDRIRYSQHFSDPGVFIRSLASRGSLGGLSSSTYLMVRAFDLAKFEVVLIETVGVGQTELEIMNVADMVAVVLVPESGDSIQGMKAGLLEIADLFVVNKADRPGADAFAHELESSLHLCERGSGVQMIRTTATTGSGLDELLVLLDRAIAKGDWRERRNSSQRLKAEAQALLRAQVEREIQERLATISSLDDFLKCFIKNPRVMK